MLDAGWVVSGSLHAQGSVTDNLVELDIRLQGVILGQVFPCVCVCGVGGGCRCVIRGSPGLQERVVHAGLWSQLTFGHL